MSITLNHPYTTTALISELGICRLTWKANEQRILQELSECYDFTKEKGKTAAIFTFTKEHKPYSYDRKGNETSNIKKAILAAKGQTIEEVASEIRQLFPNCSQRRLNKLIKETRPSLGHPFQQMAKNLPSLEEVLFPNERLTPIKDYPRYLISDYGRVWDTERGWWLISTTYGAYPQVEIDGKRLLIHRLVAETYLPNPDNLPIVNHKDENKHNAYYQNLEWCTNQYNSTYGTAIERAVNKRRGKT